MSVECFLFEYKKPVLDSGQKLTATLNRCEKIK